MTHSVDVNFDKDIDIDIDVDVDLNVDIDFDKNVDVDIKIDADADVSGNIANVSVEAEAYGKDTLVEIDATVLTIENQLSSVYLSIISAVDD